MTKKDYVKIAVPKKLVRKLREEFDRASAEGYDLRFSHVVSEVLDVLENEVDKEDRTFEKVYVRKGVVLGEGEAPTKPPPRIPTRREDA
jgi:hypothetical protein